MTFGIAPHRPRGISRHLVGLATTLVLGVACSGGGGTTAGGTGTSGNDSGGTASGGSSASTSGAASAGSADSDGGVTGTSSATGTAGSGTSAGSGSDTTGGPQTQPHEDCARDIATGEKLGADGTDLHGPYDDCDGWESPPEPEVGDASVDVAPLPPPDTGMLLHRWGVQWNPSFDDAWVGLDGKTKWEWEIDLNVDTYPGHLPTEPDDTLVCVDAIGNVEDYACLPVGQRNWPNLWAFFAQKTDVCSIWDPSANAFVSDGVIEDDAENGSTGYDVAARVVCQTAPTRATDLFHGMQGWPGWRVPPVALADDRFTWQLVDGTYDEVEAQTLLPVRVESEFAFVDVDALRGGVVAGEHGLVLFLSGLVSPETSVRLRSYWRDLPDLAGRTIAIDAVAITDFVFAAQTIALRTDAETILSGPCRHVETIPGGFRHPGVCRKAIAFRSKPLATIDPAGEPNLWLDVGAMPGSSFYAAMVVAHVVP
ncbi:MAG: hypothetical protein D6705_12400 [Deltaproteobacteria bacterium]|nr:MAG: hypothetical protein D6705_12400 [Deltaproteobacteria bacterium]